ncbi:DUF1941-domain-containing protein [Parathielavia appendiculata]|uniref:DUF1941-domain-containing protein n=1 Tax=Parathielavia appendiculata TaxID=2587402 RepID=A0AAN6Z2V9_9PEZI|nr:DUF1941-domain-containing protein [Parathielavia appendiculata]
MNEFAEVAKGHGQGQQGPSIHKMKTLLGAEDDTSRFVGLALLKSVLDNTPELRNDEEAIVSLWESIPPKFLDRLIKTGSKPHKSLEASSESSRKDANDMLDLAVSVLHTFAALLPDNARHNPKLLDRIPQLVSSLLHCSDDTTRLALETLLSLVSHPDGATVFTTIKDLSPLTEMAPSQPLALETLLHAWLNVMTATPDKSNLRFKIDRTINSLVSSFKGTDAVTLLNFLANLLPRLEPEVVPPNPKWLPSLGHFIRNLVASRPNAASRNAFTNLSAALLELYPFQAPQLLFTDKSTTDTAPFSYLLVNLLLVDLRATLPTLLPQLNSPDYPSTSRRLTSAFNTISHFIGYLLRAMDADSDNHGLLISPDHLLKLRKSISETLSLTTEFLRDRWDAAVAGALGLHPDARAAEAVTASGVSHLTLAWNIKNAEGGSGMGVADDPLALAAVRTLAIWIREDENELLRKEVSGLADMLVDLYRSSSAAGTVFDFRRAVLVAFEGLVAERKGREVVVENGGWEVLAGDLIAILEASSSSSSSSGSLEEDAARGVEIVRVLLQIAEAARPGSREAWMDLVTKVAAWYVPEADQPSVVLECQVAALQLVTALLANTHPGMQKRYVHSTTAVLGIANQLRVKLRRDEALDEALEDVLGTLAALR